MLRIFDLGTSVLIDGHIPGTVDIVGETHDQRPDGTWQPLPVVFVYCASGHLRRFTGNETYRITAA